MKESLRKSLRLVSDGIADYDETVRAIEAVIKLVEIQETQIAVRDKRIRSMKKRIREHANEQTEAGRIINSLRNELNPPEQYSKIQPNY
jgi:glutamyl-tRNA reductase